MAFLQNPPTKSLFRHPFIFRQSFSLPTHFIKFSKMPQNPLLKFFSFRSRSRSPPNPLSTSHQSILDFVSSSNGGNGGGDAETKNLPAARTYENDLTRLTLIGDVAFDQALTAAAADGGNAAEEHLASGMSTMVVETVFPGKFNEHSTVSTRLFLPAKKVKEKARKLRGSLIEDILSSTTTENILAMTFRQVVLQHLWSFELVLFSPGTERSMEDLANPREVPTCFTLSSSHSSVLSALAEVVCLCALETTETVFLEDAHNMASFNLFPWSQSYKRITSSDSSVFIYKIPHDKIVQNAKKMIGDFNSVKGKYGARKVQDKNQWWAPPAYPSLEKLGGPELCAWVNDYIPAFRLQINADKFKDAKFEGWQKSADNRWEVLLTHFQMVGLANILDLYYEDSFTIPNKQLTSGLITEIPKLSKNKNSSSLLRMLFITVVGGCFLLALGILSQLHLPYLFKATRSAAVHHVVSSSADDGSLYQPLEIAEMEALCVSVVKRIQDVLGWSGEVMTQVNLGAWIGEIPSYLMRLASIDLIPEVSSASEGTTAASPGVDLSDEKASVRRSDSDMQTAQDIASFQVVLTRDGEVIGFQPTSRVAVNHWSSNPLAKELYKGQKLSPGFLEPGLSIPRPTEAIELELLMSVNASFQFALARPVW